MFYVTSDVTSISSSVKRLILSRGFKMKDPDAKRLKSPGQLRSFLQPLSGATKISRVVPLLIRFGALPTFKSLKVNKCTCIL